MRTIKINCKLCDCEVEREMRWYNQAKKKYANMFCSRSCSTKYTNSTRTEEWYIKHGFHTVDHLSRICSNRKDKYSPFKYYITKCIERKKDDNKDYNIDVVDLKDLWEKQKGICPYTGIKMILPETTLEFSKIKSLKKASLDRIDSSKGYIKGNVEFVCLFINLAKSNFSKNDVKNFLTEINQFIQYQDNFIDYQI